MNSFKSAPIRRPAPGQPVRYYFRKNGEAFAINGCCDCNLVHVEKYKVTKRYLVVRSWRDEPRTAYFRQKYKRVKAA